MLLSRGSVFVLSHRYEEKEVLEKLGPHYGGQIVWPSCATLRRRQWGVCGFGIEQGSGTGLCCALLMEPISFQVWGLVSRKGEFHPSQAVADGLCS